MRPNQPPATSTSTTSTTPAISATATAATQPATPADIEALADSLSGCADALHAQLMRAIRQRSASPDELAHGISQQAAQALFDQEVLLRQSANHLYVQAAVLAASGLGAVRQELMELTAAARGKLRRIARLQELVALTADLVTLAGAIAGGKAQQWPAALRGVRDRIATLRSENDDRGNNGDSGSQA